MTQIHTGDIVSVDAYTAVTALAEVPDTRYLVRGP